MELHQLRYFLAVAKNKNFSRAADECHVSQPSLSQQIQKLELELGEKLFIRLKRDIVLTKAGVALRPRAERILREVEEATQDVADASQQIRGRVNVGILPTIAPYLLPRVLAAVAEKYPAMEIHLNEDETSRLLQLAAACEIDLAILSLPIHDQRFEIAILLEEELLVALQGGHHLLKKPSIALSDLEQEHFILMKEGHCLGDQALRFCQKEAMQPRVVFRSAQLETIQALVASGAGISLMPAMACKNTSESPVYRSLVEPRPRRTICALWRKENHHNRITAEFLRLLISTCQSGVS